ncbi:MAG: exodeoxyribonuclease VII large subunit [Luteitalea sp.]|nr:exodeoxyribonuclease VII large subunit [Luteitalea sp.]
MSDLFDLPFEEEDEDLVVGPSPPVDDARSSVDGPAAVADRPEPPVASRSAADTPPPRVPLPRPPGAARRVLSVTELTVGIRDHLEERFFEVWVEGELSNCRPWNTGHLFFTLKDASSQVRGFMFKSALRYLKFKPVDGLRVIARGKISVYEPKGEYQIVCEHMEPHGLGALQLAFDQLKKRLQAEGLFDWARKRPLPALPRRIGIVTSLDGAAIRDIIKVLGRRYRNAHLVIRPARVQGDGASAEIARALRAIARVPGVDVIIVGRGGGSVEDLWAFNDEGVARAIAGAPVPVISAVGHESDVTIADFVADRRAPTPSAAAEIVVAAKDDFCGRIDRLQDRLRAAARGQIQELSRRTHVLSGRPALGGFPARVAMRGRHASELSHALARLIRESLSSRERSLLQIRWRLEGCALDRRLDGIRSRLVSADGRLRAAAVRRHHDADAQLRGCASRLDALSPLAVLARGYAVAWNEDRTRVLRHASGVAPGDRVLVTLADGELDCDVRDIKGR